MDTLKKIRAATLPTLVLLTLCSAAAGQELTEGSREVVGYVGGIERDGGAFTLGGGYGYALRPRWLVIGELGFVNGDGLHGVEFGANAHYLFPLSNYLEGHALRSGRTRDRACWLRRM